jgi:hypothetical protein
MTRLYDMGLYDMLDTHVGWTSFSFDWRMHDCFYKIPFAFVSTPWHAGVLFPLAMLGHDGGQHFVRCSYTRNN